MLLRAASPGLPGSLPGARARLEAAGRAGATAAALSPHPRARGETKHLSVLIVLVTVAAYIFADTIYNFLVQPYANAVEGEEGRRLIFTALHETFFTYLKVALFASLFLSLPYVLTQIGFLWRQVYIKMKKWL